MPPPRLIGSARASARGNSNVPPLNLPTDKDDVDYPQKSQPVVWDINLNTPDTSSTVSWGVSANRSVPRNMVSSHRGMPPTPKAALLEKEIGSPQAPTGRNDSASDKMVFVESGNLASREFLDKHDDLYWKNKAVLFEAILVDQLTRSVLCDPAQDVSRASSRPFSSRVRMSANARGDSTPINLHQTLVNPTNKTVNEAVLDKRIQFDARVICRDGSIALKELSGIFFQYDNSIVVYELKLFGKHRSTSLPFIERSNYVNISRVPNGNSDSLKHVYGVHDITPGFDLVFMTSEQNCLPPALRQNRHCVVLRITAIDETAKFAILKSLAIGDYKQVLCKQMSIDERKSYRDLLKLQKRNQEFIAEQNKPLSVMKGMVAFCNRGTGYFAKDFYQNVVMDYEFLLNSEEMDVVWNALRDKTFNEEVHFEHFFNAFLGTFFEDEADLVKQVMRKLDPTRTGYAIPDNFLKFHKPARTNDLYRLLQRLELPDVKEHFSGRNGRISEDITWGAFNDYYFVVYACLKDVKMFAKLISETWGVMRD